MRGLAVYSYIQVVMKDVVVVGRRVVKAVM
jgi:hypothetical protein